MNETLPAAHHVDPRDLKSGRAVADRNGYYDSQNIVAVSRGDGQPPILSVVFHHSENREGGPGLQLFSTRSFDAGRTWTRPAAIETPERQSHDGYQLVHRRPDGSERIFVFYGWNVGSHPPGETLKRTDMQLDEGYWFRVSDDAGLTWGDRRYLIPVRRTSIDTTNPWSGSTMGMYLCDKPSVIGGTVYMAFQKTPDGAGETAGSEVFLLRSADLLTVDDPAEARWETLPNGDLGLSAPEGELGEEPHVLAVGDRLLVLWRTEMGKIAAASSDDGGETFGASFWLSYEGSEQGGHPLKNPRGSITPHRLERPSPSGLAAYVMLFYNNGRTERTGYVGRRVYWLTMGRATMSGSIEWSQPELALWWDGTGFEDRPDWNPDWAIVDGPGYPDWVEFDDGSLGFVESNKLAVRYHEVDRRLMAFIRRQPELAAVAEDGKVLDLIAPAGSCRGPVLVDPRTGGGFTLLVVVGGHRGAKTLVSALSSVTSALGEEPTDRRITKGYTIAITAEGELELMVTNGFGATLEHTTRTASGIWDGNEHTVAFIVDGGPKVVSVVVDEWLDDGGEHPQGWAFFPPEIGEVGGSDVTFPLGSGLSRFLVYDRPLLTTEAIATGRALRKRRVHG
ncbi:MAG: glycoside hydrolase [Acidimicrobiia bacterium]|nr:glycoside hydrolase [Acidimicrobiia bacterium]MDH4307640.1 glycoside hydrolase [Acidimicrobiia bacterium]MDH5292392.1 glycoside hydrolase [Acidimicrobiia bacterium]